MPGRHVDTGKGNAVRDWTTEELDKIGAAREIQVAAVRPDGSLRPYTTIWVVRTGDALYVRSYRGHDGAWYQAVLRRPEGRIQAGGLTRDVMFTEPEDADQAAIDEAYRAKYSPTDSASVESMVAPGARATTLQLLAR
jgi:hypothetical protein